MVRKKLFHLRGKEIRLGASEKDFHFILNKMTESVSSKDFLNTFRIHG